MPNLITEDQIERALIHRLVDQSGWANTELPQCRCGGSE